MIGLFVMFSTSWFFVNSYFFTLERDDGYKRPMTQEEYYESIRFEEVMLGPTEYYFFDSLLAGRVPPVESTATYFIQYGEDTYTNTSAQSSQDFLKFYRNTDSDAVNYYYIFQASSMEGVDKYHSDFSPDQYITTNITVLRNLFDHSSFYSNKDLTVYIQFEPTVAYDQWIKWKSTQAFNDRMGMLAWLLGIGSIFLWILIVGIMKPKASSLDSIRTEFLLLGYPLFVCIVVFMGDAGILGRMNLYFPNITLRTPFALIKESVNVAMTMFIFVLLTMHTVHRFRRGTLFVNEQWNERFNRLRMLYQVKPLELTDQLQRIRSRQIGFIVNSFTIVVLFVIAVESGSLLIALFLVTLELILAFLFVRSSNKVIDNLNQEMVLRIAEQVKAETMKVNLVTNVSHDLRTPLTSLTSYVDLLSKQSDLGKQSREYVGILQEKTERLTHIVSDLFDLAKSTSGNLKTDFEPIDLRKLVEQTVAEFQGNEASSELLLKMSLPSEPIVLTTDGKKLYRVIMNLLDNAFKYALPGTRVFVDLTASNGTTSLTVRNTSRYPLDFTAEEMLERFARGDSSRSTEGSGLGLAIAESFTRLCGGTLRVDIQGDMFAVEVTFR